MARPRQPTDLIKAKGKKHLTKKEEMERRSREPALIPPKSKPAVRIHYPPRLPDKLRPKFREYALSLIALNIYVNEKASGDADQLMDYLLFREDYLNEMAMKSRAFSKCHSGDEEERAAARDEVKHWGDLAQKDFRAAKSAASGLGLTVSSRCNLVIPQPEETDDDMSWLSPPKLELVGNG